MIVGRSVERLLYWILESVLFNVEIFLSTLCIIFVKIFFRWLNIEPLKSFKIIFVISHYRGETFKIVKVL